MASPRLRIVREVGQCAYCWAQRPMHELHVGGQHGAALFCNDTMACVEEFVRWEPDWRSHPLFERMMVAS